MPQNVRDFEDETGFERIVLARTMPLLPVSGASTVIDLRGPVVGVRVAAGLASAQGYGGTWTLHNRLGSPSPTIFRSRVERSSICLSSWLLALQRRFNTKR